ncbi:FadR family transcriptional regulator [Xanthobacter dioxanivorans]|uniref:FadR family transcriptional regulator n=1 Tax=Xanthobacter dioxanivorans TaxID=2528964 RepID=A0A974PSC3_9HYPH|nr:GntR family transcriptional regulator [Xanthobacter dioxanivorans]QRG08641.1 FadR family transcriptional regulator [Xanthobacter dioxanivorans]
MSAKSSAPVEIDFDKIQTHRTFEVVCEKVREKLASGHLKPGDKLPAERKMAEQLGVSRSAVREALRSLEIVGLLRLQKGVKGGAFIVAATSENLTQVLRDLVCLDAISLQDLSEARALLLDMVVRLAAERATPEDIAALEANIERTRQVIAAGRGEERLKCAFEFYHQLAASTQNRAVVYLVDSQTSVVQAYMHLRTWNMPADELLRSRDRLIRHISDGNADLAARELRRHLQKVSHLLWTQAADG